MRGFLYGVAFVIVLAACMEAAHAQVLETYTNEDLLSAGLYGIGVVLSALGFMAGKQR